jgi:hypothetical protein
VPADEPTACQGRGIGYGVPGDFELNFGRHLPALGRADHDDTGKRPD